MKKIIAGALLVLVVLALSVGAGTPAPQRPWDVEFEQYGRIFMMHRTVTLDIAAGEITDIMEPMPWRIPWRTIIHTARLLMVIVIVILFRRKKA